MVGAFILASSSPRRRALLGSLVPSFTVLTSPVEETGDSRLPSWAIEPIALPAPFALPIDDDPRLWAWRKAVDVLQSNAEGIAPGSLILAADTVVLAPGRVLGKPKSRTDAADMLRLLRGRDHFVVTGFVLLQAEEAGRATVLHAEAVRTTVVTRPFSDSEMNGYLETTEPYDKAGAYALQGLGGRLIERVEGCRTNVVGLPLCRVRAVLEEAEATLLPYPDAGYCDFCPFATPGSSTVQSDGA